MRIGIVRISLAVLTVATLAPTMASAQKAPETPKAGAPITAPSRSTRTLTAEEKAKLSQVLATVNGEPITREQLIQFLSQYTIQPGNEADAYKTGIDIVINTRLLTQFLKENRVSVPDAEVNKVVAEQEKAARENNTTLAAALADSGTTLDQMKDTIRNTLLWKAWVDVRAKNNSILEKYLADNLDTFNNSQVKASHIQLTLDPSASEADKQKAREKLTKIKQEIESGKITFADAANKYSEDPANKEQPSGGDLRWFPRKKFTESFSAAAFALSKGQISDPVETEYGMHLIQVVDRKDGGKVNLEQYREKIVNQFAVDEQNRIVTEQKKKAKIDIKPMPADLFGPAPAPAAGAAPKAKS